MNKKQVAGILMAFVTALLIIVGFFGNVIADIVSLLKE